MMNKIWVWTLLRIRALNRDEQAASMVEYAVLIAVAVLVIVVAVREFANSFEFATNYISTEVSNAISS